MGWNKDHQHDYLLQLHVRWVIEGKVFCAASCLCGKAGWKLSPMQEESIL